jgi:UPF0755 protein
LSRRALREAQGAQDEADREAVQAKRRRPITAVVVLTLVALVAVVGFVAGKPIYDEWVKPNGEAEQADYPGPGEGQAIITVDPGDTGSRIGEKLVAAGVVATTGAFVEACAQAGERAASIQPGTYTLMKKMSATGALAALLDPANRSAIAFTVPEGKRAEEVYQIIGRALADAELGAGADAGAIDAKTAEQTALVKAAANDTAAIGLPPEANGLVEGWLFPETYAFNLATEPTVILGQMVKTTVGVLEDLGVPRERWFEIIVMGSLVEKESKLAPDRPKVARVFYNRLAKNWRLESDATVKYGWGNFDSDVASSNEALADPNPYNTYIHDGLPAGAICNPGREALKAALTPADGNWLFFCAVNPQTGETEFNETAEGHAQSVAKWQAWEREHA